MQIDFTIFQVLTQQLSFTIRIKILDIVYIFWNFRELESDRQTDGHKVIRKL